MVIVRTSNLLNKKHNSNLSVEMEAHTVPDFKAPIYGIMDYEGLEHAGAFM